MTYLLAVVVSFPCTLIFVDTLTRHSVVSQLAVTSVAAHSVNTHFVVCAAHLAIFTFVYIFTEGLCESIPVDTAQHGVTVVSSLGTPTVLLAVVSPLTSRTLHTGTSIIVESTA